jgi:Family of unknown function (DUF6236)
MSFGHALYYPHIHLRDKNWLKAAFLFWDHISRIVPTSVTTQDDDDILRLRHEANFIRDLAPDAYLSGAVFQEFNDYVLRRIDKDAFLLKHLNTSRDTEEGKRFAAFVRGSPRNRKKLLSSRLQNSTTYIHVSKMSGQLLEELIEIGLAKPGENEWDGWIRIDNEIGDHYMSCLAKAISLTESLPMVTDRIAEHRTAEFFETQKDLYFRGRLEARLGNLLIACYLPANLNAVTVPELIEFKKKYADERLEFHHSISELCASVSRIDSRAALEDALDHHARRLKKQAKALEKAFASHKLMATVKVLSASVLFQAPLYLDLIKSDPWRGLGIASGLALNFARELPSIRADFDELQNRPLSYLLNIRSAFLRRNVKIKSRNLSWEH